MKNRFINIVIANLCLWAASGNAHAQASLDQILPVRGLCIAAPNPSGVDTFVKFIGEELAPRAVNTLILRVDFNYQFTSRPELAARSGLSKADVKKLVAVCHANHIRLIPQINLLGHQSWQRSTGRLLQVYPDFDETPWVKGPEKYAWPNPDGLYCRSYCPLHPKVHEVIFPLVDEICEAFESDAFHAGMDEVFYIGEAKCPRCGGKDKAELFANEVNLIRDHLKQNNRALWIWGDRLIDGKLTGMGEWEASMNGTARAVDLVAKDVFICDWHYERADLSPVYFAMKGLSVATCPWTNPKSASRQLQDLLRFREQANRTLKPKFTGMIQTVWSDAGSFLRDFYAQRKGEAPRASEKSAARCFIQLFDEILALNTGSTTTPESANVKKSDSALLQGTWTGQEIGGSASGSPSLVIAGTTIEFHGATPQEWYKATFTLREDTNPKQFDAILTECSFPQYVGKIGRAIYKLEDGKLTLTGNEPGNPIVPSSFDAPGARQFILNRKQ
jgi:uncharacterized protein (TIGR03067 family)